MKEVDRWALREIDLQGRLRMANDLLLQKDQELKAKCQRAKKVLLEKAKGKRSYGRRYKSWKMLSMYEQGFNEGPAQVKHFASGNLIDLSRVGREKKLNEILVVGAPTNQDAPEVAVVLIIQIGVEEEEEEGGNPHSSP